MKTQMIKNNDHLNTNIAKTQAEEFQKKQPTLSESAAKLLLEQMKALSGSSNPSNALAMVACARGIADLIRANTEAKKV